MAEQAEPVVALFCLAVAVVSWLLDDALKNSGYDLQGKERFNISSIVTAEVQNMMGLGPGLRLDYRLTLQRFHPGIFWVQALFELK